MEINTSTPALLFGAIALIMLAYTNRFFVLAKLIRDIHTNADHQHRGFNEKQIPILRKRLRLIQFMQASGVVSFLLCTLSMFFLFLQYDLIGRALFILSVIALMASLLGSLREVILSTKALDMVLDGVDKKHQEHAKKVD